MLMLLRRTCEDSWTEPCSEGQPLASKGRREAGGVVLAGLDDVSRARVNVANPFPMDLLILALLAAGRPTESPATEAPGDRSYLLSPSPRRLEGSFIGD